MTPFPPLHPRPSRRPPRPAALALAALFVAVAGCQTTPPENAEVAAARRAFAQASADPAVARSAGIEYERASDALSRAERAWNDRQAAEQIAHLAYLAQRQAQVALAVAARVQTEEQIRQAGVERERVQLEARTRQAEAARAEALRAQSAMQAAQSQAQQARSSAEELRAQAEQARQQTEQARQQTEQARQQAEAARTAAAADAQRAAQEAERARALERDMQALQARPTPRGLVVTLGDVLFASGSAGLRPGAERHAQQLAETLKQHPERRVRIEGFTDSQGPEAQNLELSRRRAESFREALVEAGLPADRTEVRAFGESLPVADNATPVGRQQNRRVEVVISDGQGRFPGN